MESVGNSWRLPSQVLPSVGAAAGQPVQTVSSRDLASATAAVLSGQAEY